VDLEQYIILSNVIFSVTGVVVVINLVLDIFGGHAIFGGASLLLSGLAGAVLGALPIYALWYASKFWNGQVGQWMGFGDVELMLLLGAATGARLVGLVLFLAIVLGGIVSVFLLLFGKKTMKSRVPFGIFLTPAAIVAMFYGERILHWYLAFLGF